MSILKYIVSLKCNLDIIEIEENKVYEVPVDHIYLQDGNIPTIAKFFKDNGIAKVFDNNKITCFFDHSVLSNTVEISNILKDCESFISKFNFNFYKDGEGISHLIACENNIYKPFEIVIGSDSHTITGGAFNCLSLGMGSTDVIYSMVSGKTWLKIPETVYIELIGQPSNITTAKDIVLFILSRFTNNEFLYKEIIWTGEYIKTLHFDDILTFSNLSVELGAKIAFFENKLANPLYKKYTINIENLTPYIAKPHLPSNSVPYYQIKDIRFSYVFIGSCTNSKLSDIEILAYLLKNKKLHSSIKCILTPGTKNIYLAAIQKGYIETLIKSGVLITPPGCGICIGTQGPIPADNENIFSTMNRNFKGRMGNKNANIYLGSPYMAAHIALLGRIPHENELYYKEI